MQAIKILTALWEDIAMDFVTGLLGSTDPATEAKYNAILVIVDRFTKYAEMIPCKKECTAD